MDRKETLQNLLISLAIFIAVVAIAPRIFKPVLPPPPNAGAASRVAGDDVRPPGEMDPAVAGERPNPDGAVGVSTGDASPDRKSPDWSVLEVAEVRTVTIGAEHAAPDRKLPPSPYRMRLSLSNIGASIDSATMTDHAQVVRRPERYELLSVVDSPSGSFRSLAVEKLNIDGVDVVLADRRWSVEGPTAYRSKRGGVEEEGQEVTFSLILSHQARPALELIRRFRLPQQAPALRRHDLDVSLTVRNLTEDPRRVVVTHRGGLGIPRVNQTDDRVVDQGVLRGGGGVVGSRHTFYSVSTSSAGPVSLFKVSATERDARLSWAATANTYFTCTLAPIAAAGAGVDGATGLNGGAGTSGAADVSAVDLDGDPSTHADVTIRFVTPALTLAAGAEAALETAVYLGEKENDGFRNVPEYRDRNYYYQISQGFGYCTFNWLVELMILLLDGLRYVVRDYGIAIIILVCIVRILLHPITKKAQVNMVRMQQRMGEFAPKMEELKRRFGNDKARLQQEIMKLYREHDINPASQFLTCIPMFIQLPVWAALYLSLSNNIRMRHEPFLFTWVHDLTAPDALYTFASPVTVPLLGWQLPSFNLLPILVTISMYVQTKLQPKPKPNPNMTPEQRAQQESMQRMMPIMSVMMLFFFYHGPSGLNLYIMFSSLIGAIEQWWIRKHIKELEASGRFLKAASKSADDAATGKPAPTRPSKSGGGFFGRLQKMAEDAQKQKYGKPDRKKR